MVFTGRDEKELSFSVPPRRGKVHPSAESLEGASHSEWTPNPSPPFFLQLEQQLVQGGQDPPCDDSDILPQRKPPHWFPTTFLARHRGRMIHIFTPRLSPFLPFSLFSFSFPQAIYSPLYSPTPRRAGTECEPSKTLPPLPLPPPVKVTVTGPVAQPSLQQQLGWF